MAKAAILAVLEIVLAVIEQVAATTEMKTLATEGSHFLAVKKQ